MFAALAALTALSWPGVASSEREFLLKPMMGMNTWNQFACNISETLVGQKSFITDFLLFSDFYTEFFKDPGISR